MPTSRAPRAMSLRLKAFVGAVVIAGAIAIVQSIARLPVVTLNGYAPLLALLTIVSGRFGIKVPGRPATVSVSEVFVFASILMFGVPVAVLTVAVDGLWISLTQRDRRLYRACFNVAEPAISTWLAAHVFFLVAGVAPGTSLSTSMPVLVPSTVAMTAVFFILNSGLSAVAVAFENSTSPYEVWRSHAWYLAVNYQAAASIATMAVSSGSWINYGVVGLVAPLLVLSYVAYREASGRIDEVHRHMADVEHLYRASVEMLAIAVDAKDQVTHGHIRRVQRHTLAVAAALGVTDHQELKAIEAGALLHDIGKLAVPDYVLNKPSALTQAEFDTMKRHASMGARILTAVEFPYPIVPIVRHHHEQWDGGGYPDGLVGAEIPLGARILSVVDCFDALTSERPYRAKLTDAKAIEILRSRTGTFYDPAIVEQFIAMIPELREGDAAEERDAQASVVAGFANAPTRRRRDAERYAPQLEPSMSIPPAAQALIDERVGRMGGDACFFRLTSGREALIVAHATSALRESVADLHVPVGSGVSGWVAANRSAIRRADAALDVGDVASGFGLRSCASVPVFVCAEIFGVLTVYFRDPILSDRDVDTVGILAQEVGLFIARASGPLVQMPAHAAGRFSMAAVS